LFTSGLMRVIGVVDTFLLLLVGCSRGVWLEGGQYRPKKNIEFPIRRKPFRGSELIYTNYLYITLLPHADGVDVCYLGFYGDGRTVAGCEDINDTSRIKKYLEWGVSWETAIVIGYYTTEGRLIKMQYFYCYEGGSFDNWIGLIKKDTLEVSPGIDKYNPRRSRTFIKSHYRLLR